MTNCHPNFVSISLDIVNIDEYMKQIQTDILHTSKSVYSTFFSRLLLDAKLDPSYFLTQHQFSHTPSAFGMVIMAPI